MEWVIISRLRLGKLIPNPRKLSYRKVHYHFPLTSSIICRHSGHTADVYANFARGRRGLLTRQIKRNANKDKMRLLRCRVSPKSNNKSTAENKNKLQKGNNKLLLPQSTSLCRCLSRRRRRATITPFAFSNFQFQFALERWTRRYVFVVLR